MASSSSANNVYDVFLSFRGTDTRNNFTSHLYKALCDNNVKAFIDNSIDRGEEITSFLEGIIEGVKLSIIVFSSDYASSTFCLDEMVKIMECKETKAQIVLPIFYRVYPSGETYQEAFTTHRANFKGKKGLREETIDNEMKVENWKSSLDKAFILAGWHIDDYSNEASIIETITRDVLKKLSYQFEGVMKTTTMVGQTSEDYLEKIIQLLMNDENPKVGVWGMGGVGKTTIVTHINNTLLEDARFSRQVYWVTVSKNSSVFKLQSDVAKMINLDLSGEDNESKRAVRLLNELMRIDKFVLILDDVWEPFEAEDVGIPLMGGRKLLLTTRNLGVCQRMMCKPIEVKPLFQHEAVDLFMKESKIQINDSREIVHSIVEECAGLPLAIVVVARSMREIKGIRNWRNTLRELRKPCEGENNEMEEKVYKPLKFSYDHLPNDRCRQCFLYCSLFPEDHEFRREDLITYWIGEGLINELDSRQAELDKGDAILDELTQSSLLENNYVSYTPIKMHDVIRDMSHIVVKVGSPFQEPFESVLVLSETMFECFQNSAPRCLKLKTLVLQGYNRRAPSSCFFVNMQNLNVLHMERVTSIPDSITNLRNLRVLIIFDCFHIKCSPSLGGLEKLRHLIITYALDEIPKGIERLINLRVLDLSNKYWTLSRSYQSGVVDNLSNLQFLDLTGTGVEVEPEALISLEKLEIMRVHFYNLHKLNCYLKSGHWRRLLDYIITYGEDFSEHWLLQNWEKGMDLQAIRDVEKWKGESGIFLPDDIQNLGLFEWDSSMFHVLQNPNFVDLQTLNIRRYKSRYLFTVDLAQLLLYNVQKLTIGMCYELDEIIEREQEHIQLECAMNRSNYINYPTILLPNLKTLELYVLPKLRNVYRGRMVCPSLELIHIQYCDKLERLPFCMEKNGNKQNPTIKLRVYFEEDVVSRWWESLQWDDPNDKLMYHLSETLIWIRS